MAYFLIGKKALHLEKQLIGKSMKSTKKLSAEEKVNSQFLAGIAIPVKWNSHRTHGHTGSENDLHTVEHLDRE